ncbi:MAG: flagellar basal body L-ring protein FlgH [Steroidobacteraceae bacterium]|jgi:flagellar L-ring protein precursor FlgH|nr:flagellar basal body L-ring protein FlgH [Steroidobacteraceae bacterium]
MASTTRHACRPPAGVRSRAASAVLLAAVVAAAGCAAPFERELPQPRGAAHRVAVAPVAPSDGAIYQPGREIAFFEDLKARRVGDLVMIRLQEATNARKSSSTETSKETSVSMPGPTIAGRPVTVAGVPVLDMGVDGTRSFQGEGSSSQQNALTGTITAVVVEVLGNGNLVIEGEKWLRLNQGDELVKVRGVVRAVDVLPDNSVTSDRVADARISYAGRGALASANRQGWLSRFFNSALYPY